MDLNLKNVEWSLPYAFFSPDLPCPWISFSLFCTNLWQQQQLLRPSLLRPEVETLPLFLIHRDCKSYWSKLNLCAAVAGLLLPSFSTKCWVISLSTSELQELSMESGIDPGQDYYAQDYYNYDQGWACSPQTVSLFISITPIHETDLHRFI